MVQEFLQCGEVSSCLVRMFLLLFFPCFAFFLSPWKACSCPPSFSLHCLAPFLLPITDDIEPLSSSTCFVNSDHSKEFRSVNIFTLKKQNYSADSCVCDHYLMYPFCFWGVFLLCITYERKFVIQLACCFRETRELKIRTKDSIFFLIFIFFLLFNRALVSSLRLYGSFLYPG